MITLLAQAAGVNPSGPIDNLLNTLVRIFSRADTLAHPAELVKHLQALSVVWAVVFMIVGILCLTNGFRIYKFATVGMALLIGLCAGYWLGSKLQTPYIVAGCLGLLLAVSVFPMMKFAVALLAGLAGAFLGANLWVGISHAINVLAGAHLSLDAYWVGALLGLISCGMLAFILYDLTIVLFTSMSGATIAVLGALALLVSFEPWQDAIARGLNGRRLVIPLLVFVPAAIGLILQEYWSGQTNSRRNSS